MTDKTPDELAEEYCSKKENMICDDFGYPYTSQAEKIYLAGYAAALPKWISVKERLPENEKAVQLFDLYQVQRYNSCVGYRIDDKFFELLAHDQTFDPTHWQPLPEPPKDL